MRVESDSTLSTARTPSTVFSRTGQMQPKTIVTIFISSEIPMMSISTGISTGGGIARRNSISGSRSARSHGMEPTASPITIPITMAASSPAVMRARLGSTSVRNRPENHTSPKVSNSTAGVGT